MYFVGGFFFSPHSFCGNRVDNPKLRNSRYRDPQAFQLKWILNIVWKINAIEL